MDECCGCHKTRVRSDQELKKLTNRLSRIEGQVRGLREMLERDVYCIDVLRRTDTGVGGKRRTEQFQ